MQWKFVDVSQRRFFDIPNYLTLVEVFVYT